MLNARILIIDNQIESINFLVKQLTDFPEIKQVTFQTDSVKGFIAIKKEEPDIVFLNINMPKLNGIEILDLIHNFDLHVHVIVTTDDSKNIKLAAKYGILYYLLKPFEIKDIKKSIENYYQHYLQHLGSESSHDVIENKNPIKISSAFEDFYFANDEIIFLEADGNYTKIFSTTNKLTICSYNLGKVQQKLPSDNFFRVSRKVIINVHFLKKVDKKNKVCILNFDNIEIPFSVSILKQSGL